MEDMDPIDFAVMNALVMNGHLPFPETYHVYKVNLTFDILAKWFKNFRDLIINKDNNYVALTLQERLSTGQYQTIQVIFNQDDKSIHDYRIILSESVDDTINQAHDYGQSSLVIWQ